MDIESMEKNSKKKLQLFTIIIGVVLLMHIRERGGGERKRERGGGEREKRGRERGRVSAVRES